jgi:hypothetical protein
MSWLKRSSGDEPPGEQAPDVERPEIEPLSAAEVEWVRSTVAGLAEQDVLDHNIDDLGRHYDELLTVWLRLREPDRPDPSTVITQIGLAFGQYVVDQAGLEWVVATGASGPEIALHRAQGDVLVYPTAMVAERWAAEQAGVLPPLARATVEAVRPAP